MTTEGAAESDQETWDSLRRELEDIGVAADLITEKRAFIIEWFREAVIAGKLDEDPASDGDELTASSDFERMNVDEDDGWDITPPSPGSVKSHASSGFYERDVREGLNVTPPTGTRARTEDDTRQPSPIPEPTVIADNSTLPSFYVKSFNSFNHGFTRIAPSKPSSLPKVRAPSGIRAQDEEDPGESSPFSEPALIDETPSKASFSVSGSRRKPAPQSRLSVSYLMKKVLRRELELFTVAENGTASSMSDVLRDTADIEVRDAQGLTALMRAARSDNTATAKALLDHGADRNALDKFHYNALRYATEGDRVNVARMLLMHHIGLNREFAKYTPLSLAASHGCIRLVKLLLEFGADVKELNQSGGTALHCAVWYEGPVHLLAFDDLLEWGADINALDNEGNTPLCNATTMKYVGAVKVLLDKGADTERQSNDQKWTPLISAILRKSYEIAKLLLSHGARLDARDFRGETPAEKLLALGSKWRKLIQEPTIVKLSS